MNETFDLDDVIKNSFEETNLPSLDECLARNEQGDAMLFASLFRQRYIFDHAAGEWYRYRAPYWQRANPAELWHVVGNQVAAEYTRAAGLCRGQNDRQRESALLTRANALRTRKRVVNILDWSTHLLALPAAGWDVKPLLLTLENGVLDLSDGSLRQAQPEEYLNAHLPARWLGLDAPAPLWQKTLSQIFGGETELIAFVQRLLGYALGGSSSERILPIFYGAGANGKTTLIELVSSVLGTDFCLSTHAGALMENHADDDRPRPFIHSLRGKRLVWASETREGQRLDLSLIKALTGGDTLSARTLYARDFVTFRPSHTVFLITNHLPHVSAQDQAAWDRIAAVEFKSRFVDHPQNPGEYLRDPNLRQRLAGEAPGILAWLVRGCLEWQRIGLGQPEQVIQLNTEYRQAEDDFGLFCSEALDTSVPGALTRSSVLYLAYRSWAQENGYSVMSGTAFGRRMSLRHPKFRLNNGFHYQGVQLR